MLCKICLADIFIGLSCTSMIRMKINACVTWALTLREEIEARDFGD